MITSYRNVATPLFIQVIQLGHRFARLTPSRQLFTLNSLLYRTIDVRSATIQPHYLMKGQKPKITSWRAFVDGKQIGSGYASKFQANQAAKHLIKKKIGVNAHVAIDVRPSYSPKKALSC